MGRERRRRDRTQSRPVYVEDIHRAIFGRRIPDSKKAEEFDKGVRLYMKKKRARR
jgi:hypothetical protein